jgi:sulfur-oxidizing protein SoxX
MPRTGSAPSRRMRLARWRGLVLLLLGCGPAAAADGMASLTGRPGDPVQGRAIVASRQRGLCLLCHAGPFPEERFQGDLAPSLAGAGSRLTEAQLRLRLVDGRRLNPDSIMPSYHRTEGLVRVGPAWQGKPILTAEEIEDVVAFLLTLRNEPLRGGRDEPLRGGRDEPLRGGRDE